MPIVDLVAVSDALFVDPRVVARLTRDYAFAPPTSATELASSLIASFGQLDAQERPLSSRDVYRAAVRALGSNSRHWSAFLSKEARLSEHLCDFEPNAVQEALKRRRLTVRDIAACLPGPSSDRDAKAIKKWADLLNLVPNLPTAISELRAALDRSLPRSEVPIAAAAVFGFGLTHAPVPHPPQGMPTWKLPGMGAVLASEFLRNLHWDAFKPDRHIKRLFARWFPAVVSSCEQRTNYLSGLLGLHAKELLEFLRYSLVGVAVTPPGTTFIEVDNLVWALGAYVEKKNKESDRIFWHTTAP